MPARKRRLAEAEQQVAQRAVTARARRLRAWRAQVIVAVLLVLAVALRAANLTAQSLWADEGNSVRLTERPLALVIDAARGDVHPPGYYLLLWTWVRILGQSEASVRALSVVIGAAVVWLVYLLAERVWNPRAGWLAAFCAAVSPFQIRYSQEVRMYILVALLAVATVYAFVRWLEVSGVGGRARLLWGMVYVAVAGAGLWTHYSFPIVLAAVNVAWLCWLLASRPAGLVRTVLAWLGLQLAAVVLYAPWVPTAWSRTFSYGAISARTPLVEIAGQWLKLLSVGETVPADDLTRWLTVGIVGLAAFGIWAGVGSLARLRAGERRAIAALCLALLLIAPAAMMIALELSGRSAYRPKFFLVASPPFCALVGAGISLLERPSGPKRTIATRAWLLLGIGLVGVASARSLRNYYTDPAYARSDYRSIAADIAVKAGRDDAVLLVAPNQWEVFTYYYRGDLPVYPLCRARPPVASEVVAELEEIASAHERLYLLLWALDEADPDRIVEGWLQANTFRVSDVWYGDVRLATFATPSGDVAPPMTMALDDVRFGSAIALREATIAPVELAAGETVQVTLYWEALDTLAARYKVFLHLVSAADHILTQNDSEPGGGFDPTTNWTPERGLIADRYGLVVPSNAQAGDYRLLVGLYDASGAPRLAITAAGEALGDALHLADLRVR